MDLDWTEGPSQELDGEVVAEPLVSEDLALINQANFIAGLEILGLPSANIAEVRSILVDISSRTAAIDEYNLAHGNAMYFMTPRELAKLYAKKSSAITRLGRWLTNRRVEVERTVELTQRIPMFVLSAPDVKGCTATFSTSEQVTRNLECKLAVYGSGLSVGSKGSCSAKCEFSAENGEAKLVFTQAEITVGEVSVIEGGRKVGQGRQITAIEYLPKCEPAVALIPVGGGPTAGALVNTYPLSDDTSGGIAAYGYEYTQARTVGFGLGLKAFGADISLTVDVTLERAVGLTYKLKGGHEYQLHQLSEGQGIVWKVEPPAR